MCYGSTLYAQTTLAVVGQSYLVSNGGDVGHPVGILHLEGDGPRKKDAHIAVAACVKGKTRVTIAHLPPSLMQQLGVGETVSAILIPDEARNRDLVELPNGLRLPLVRFAHPEVRVNLVPAFVRAEAAERTLETA